MPIEKTPTSNAARSSALVGQLPKATWDTRETLDWIIYRGRKPEEIDTALTQGLHMNDDIMGCLWARAGGDPRSWVPDPPPADPPPPAAAEHKPPANAEHKPPRYSGKSQFFWSSCEVGSGGRIERVFTAASCRARMRRWMRDTKKSASELFAGGEALRKRANEVVEAQNAADLGALAELNNAARGGLLPVHGCKRFTVARPACNPIREEIPREQFDELRQINVLGNINIHDDPGSFAFLEHDPPFFSGLAYEPEDVRRLWPAGKKSTAAPATRTFSREKVKLWLVDRHKHLPERARLPSEAPELAAAQDKFPGLSRHAFRELKNELRPFRDRKTGRPSTLPKLAAEE